MKIIISHDVDHLTVWEHRRDLLVPKHMIRNCIEMLLGRITPSEVMQRSRDLLRNKWQNLEALTNFNACYGIPSTFFFGVAQGLGLNYSITDAAFWMKKVYEAGFDVGVHGIAFENIDDIKKEYESFKRISGFDSFGIRMHYLRLNDSTFNLLDQAGYSFDTSVYSMKNPFKVGGLWEFPLHVMDGYIVCKDSKWQNQNLNQARETTRKILDEAFGQDIRYFTILFHDRYFSDSFGTWKKWYIWLIEHLKANEFGFINYSDAVKELESRS